MNKFRKPQILKIYEFILLVLSVILILNINYVPSKNAPSVLLIPPKDIQYFALGYREILADMLWIRSIQDIELCGDANLIPGTKDLPDGPGLLVAKCKNGWSYRMLDAVTELAPKYHTPYKAGAAILSVIAHDAYGAGKLYEKAIARFPGDWEMEYRAAYHFMAAFQNYEQASEYLISAGKHGAPRWVFSLAAKLKSKMGQAILAKPILEEAIAADPEGQYADRLKTRLDEVNEIIKKEKEGAENSNLAPHEN